MVGETGVEPAASWSRTKRATRLRYSPIFKIILTVSGFRVRDSKTYNTRFDLKCPEF